MNRANVTRLLTYLEQLKAQGEEDKWEMSEYLADRWCHGPLLPAEITNWHCETAGCFVGSWAIIKVMDGGQPPETTMELIHNFTRDFELEDRSLNKHVTSGQWSPHHVYATLDEAIAYLSLCLEKDTMDVRLG